ncbi:MAG: hypothetical protein ACYTBJ_00665 [Planctomycetota bacterium]|jgi:hypothetical protein
MGGTITKKDWWKIARTFGIKTAVKVLFSREKTALQILMEA